MGQETEAADCVRSFISEWAAAWHTTRQRVDQDPLGALDEWDAAVTTIDSRLFVEGASGGSQGAFPRGRCEHDPKTELIQSVVAKGSEFHVTTTAPHRSHPGRSTRYTYRVVLSGANWRIAGVDESDPGDEIQPPVSDGGMVAVRSTGSPDYSSVDVEAAKRMFEHGELSKLLLLPEEFGGTDAIHNVVYVPSFVVALKQHADQTIKGMVANGSVSRYRATPEYQGSSAVPIALHVHAFEPGHFMTELVIWGDALVRAANLQ